MTIVSLRVLSEYKRYNEAEVRFNIIDPIIRKLGYPDADNTYLKLEQQLEYPYYHIGHRSRKDIPIGRADYLVGIHGRKGSFIVEAKAPSEGISLGTIEQAHSYAAHAQVGANFFVICDGNSLKIFETLASPNKAAIVDISISEINQKFYQVENLLSPFNLEKNCQADYDLNLRLADGLGSSMTIPSGEYRLNSWSIRFLKDGVDCTEIVKRTGPWLSEMNESLEFLKREFDFRVQEGRVTREVDGRIAATVVFPGVTKNSTKSMRMTGLDKITFYTRDEFLSSSSDSPTLFESNPKFSIGKGSEIFPTFGAPLISEADVECEILARVLAYVQGKQVSGDHALLARYRFCISPEIELTMEVDFWGDLTLNLAN